MSRRRGRGRHIVTDDGHRFPQGLNTRKPEDFLTDPATGMRSGEQTKPNGTIVIDLKHSKDLEHKTIVPFAVWDKGEWFQDLKPDIREMVTNVPEKDEFNTFVCSGEGTPGNYMFRCYVLPADIAGQAIPEHPTKWLPDKYDWAKNNTESRSGWGGGWSKKDDKSYTSSSLPLGLKIRCLGCGHWYSERDLKDHVQNCCPAVNGEDGDWAMACACCESLDNTAKTKPGFPRKMKAPTPAAEVQDPEPVIAGFETSPGGR